MGSENKISIVIAVYNAEKYLSNAIQSIIQQEYENKEIIVIDGGSKDTTVNIIEKYSEHINYWVSEKDNGIYDAWNKGVKRASGNWIMFLGADDCLLEGALGKYNEYIKNFNLDDFDFISSKMQMIDEKGRSIRVKGWKWEWPLFLKEVTIAHPGALHAKKLFDTYGLFDTNYKITGDYELLLRPQSNLKTAFMDLVTVKMSEGGASDSVAAMKEHKRASINTGGNSQLSASLNFCIVYLKFKVKKALRRIGLNVYLKR